MRILYENDVVCFAATTIEDGNFRVPSGDIKAYSTNLRERLQTLNRSVLSIAVARLCHGTTIAHAAEDGSQSFSKTDGLVTSIPSLALVVTGGDCTPIFLFDVEHRAIGLAHSGRKGTLGDIAAQLVEKMRNEFGSSVEHLRAVIGPGICGEHYSVPEKMAQEFSQSFLQHVIPSSELGLVHLELRGIIRDQFVAAGLLINHITPINECTYEHPERWFSFRRDKHEGKDENDLRVQAFVCWIKKTTPAVE